MLSSVRVDLTILLVVAYLVGSVPTANLLARRRGAPDLRTIGDRNPGFWNARSVLTAGDSAVVFVADASKGALAVAAARALDVPWQGAYAAALAAMVGHAWPVFDRFRGGRSVLTWVGATFVLAPAAAGVALALVGAHWIVSRRFPAAVALGVVALPVVQLALDGRERTAASGALMTFVGLRFAAARLAERRTQR
jgi:glycerol-3-phosphate acyltransferase PlsY